MKKSLYFAIAIAAFSTASCSEDKANGTDSPAVPGTEVQFGATLLPSSRTHYGEENTSNQHFPIMWNAGDLIAVACPQGATTSAVYSVATQAENQAYASSLTHTTPAGIQWGEGPTGDFYAIYPSTDAQTPNVSAAQSSVKASVTIESSQVAKVAAQGGTVAEPNNMKNVLMYAQEMGVASGSPVALTFYPYSTILEVELQNPKSASGSTLVNPSASISSVTLKAPAGVNIAGTFDLTFDTEGHAGENNETVYNAPTASNPTGTGASNTISVQPLDYNGSNVLLDNSRTSLKVKFALVPREMVLNSGWSIEVKTLDQTYSIKFPDTGTATSRTLKPGKVHKVKLPQFSVSDTWTVDASNWLATIPRNVYVSELSLPGSWYSYDGGTYSSSSANHYQGSSVQEQYKAGVRAFHFETRIAGQSTFGDTRSVVISGTGSNVAGYYRGGTAVVPYIKQIAGYISQDEFAVVTLNMADGGATGLSESNRQWYLQGLATALNNQGITNLYTDDITPNTTINDVKGKLILLLAIDNDNEINSSSYINQINALYGRVNLSWDQTEGNVSLVSPLRWKATPGTNPNVGVDAIRNNTDASAMFLNYTLANRTYGTSTASAPASPAAGVTTDVATITQRINSINTIIKNSSDVYKAGTHNVWFLIGAGGTLAPNKTDNAYDGSQATVARELNSRLLTIVNQKLTGEMDPSPLGLVYCNLITSNLAASGSSPAVNGQDLIDAIILMNDRFYLNRDTNAPAWPDGDPTKSEPSTQSNYTATFLSVGDAFDVK